MLFKSARRDGVVAEDPTEFVETVRRERRPKIKRPFALPELRSVLDLASDEWRSMILFGLYSGQRLGDIATLRWNNIDLVHGELRFSTRKTEKTMILPLAQPLRKYVESLCAPDDRSAPLHPKAFDLLEGHRVQPRQTCKRLLACTSNTSLTSHICQQIRFGACAPERASQK